METLTEIAIRIFIQAVLISGILGYFFSMREERMKKAIEEEFIIPDKFLDVRFNFMVRALEELLASIKLQLMRSKITLQGYHAISEYRKKKLKECNETIRGLLLEKGHLISVDLIAPSEKFISHYD